MVDVTGPAAGVELLVGTTKGAFRFVADPACASWRREGPLIAGWTVNDLIRLGRGRLLAATSHAAYGATVRVSDDDGRSWRQLVTSPRYRPDSGRMVQAIWRFGSDASGATVYAGVGEAGLFVSRDRGESWAEVRGQLPRFAPGAESAGADTFVHSVVVDPREPDRLWVAGAGVGVVSSTDGGRTWLSCNDGLTQQLDAAGSGSVAARPHKLAIDPRPPHPLYLQHFDAVFRSFDGGRCWQRIDAGLPSGFGFPIAVDHTGTAWVAPLTRAAERYMPGGRLAVYRSVRGDADEAVRWSESRAGLPEEPQFVGVLRDALTTDDLDPVGVYFGTTAGELFASADGGQSWQQLPGQLTRITSIRAATLSSG